MAESVENARVQVGWFCSHEDEPYGSRTHMSHDGKWRKKKGWIDTFPQPNTTKSLAFLDHRDPEKRPHCAKAVPVFIDVVPVATSPTQDGA